MPWGRIDPAWLLQLFRDTTAVMWTADAGGHIPDVPDWERLTGQGAAEMEGEGWLARVHPDDVERVQAAWRTAVAHGSAYNTDYRIRCADGIYRWFNARGTPILDPDGTILKWVGICLAIPGTHRFGRPGPERRGHPEEFHDIRPAALRAARAMLNISADELASRAGVSVSTVRRLEANEPQIHARRANVRRVLDALGRESLEVVGSAGTIFGVVCREDAAAAPGDGDWTRAPAVGGIQ